MKEEIGNYLSNIDGKILIIIDDIDRLNIKEIAQIFQLVKAVADFPNIVYLLSFDRDTVKEALEKGHVTDGEQYLEKIIQIPFEIPVATTGKIREKFCEEVLKIVKSDYLDSYFRISLSKTVFPFMIDIRKMYRLLMIYKFKYNAIGKEVDESDLLNVCAVELFKPELYKWIKKNKGILIANIDEYPYSELKEKLKKEEYDKRYSGSLEEYLEMEGLNKEDNKEIIEHLFPKSYYFKKDKQLYMDKDYLEREYKIGSSKYFDRYFTLSLETNALEKNELENLTYISKKEEVLKVIGSDYQKISEYMDYILNRVVEPKYEIARTKELMDIMAELNNYYLQNGKLEDDPYHDSNIMYTSIRIESRAADIICSLLENIITKRERVNILREKLGSEKSSMLSMYKKVLDKLEYKCRKKDENEKENDDLLLKIEDIEKLREDLKIGGDTYSGDLLEQLK